MGPSGNINKTAMFKVIFMISLTHEKGGKSMAHNHRGPLNEAVGKPRTKKPGVVEIHEARCNNGPRDSKLPPPTKITVEAGIRISDPFR